MYFDLTQYFHLAFLLFKISKVIHPRKYLKKNINTSICFTQILFETTLLSKQLSAEVFLFLSVLHVLKLKERSNNK